MSYRFDTLEGRNDILKVEIDGDMSMSEISSMIDDFFERPYDRVLLDMRNGTFGDLKRPEMVEIIERLKDPERTHGEKAAIVTENKVLLGLLLIMNTIGRLEHIPTEYKIFREMDEAENWLKAK